MKIARNSVVLGDCADTLKETAPLSVYLIYFDPPFFKQKTQ
jgi:16S rRNA G966 N2-methylase RsmD